MELRQYFTIRMYFFYIEKKCGNATNVLYRYEQRTIHDVKMNFLCCHSSLVQASVKPALSTTTLHIQIKPFHKRVALRIVQPCKCKSNMQAW